MANQLAGLIYHQDGAACWSSAGFLLVPLHSLSQMCKETSCKMDSSIFRSVYIIGALHACLHRPFHLCEVHHVLDGAGLAHKVEPPQACVSVAGVEGLEAVAHVSLTGNLSQFTGQILE